MQPGLTATVTHVPCGITHGYLPPAAGVTFSPLFQPKLLLDLATPEGCKAGLTDAVQYVRSPCPKLYIAVTVAINTTVRDEIRTWVRSYCSHSMRSRVYASVGRPSVRPSVCLSQHGPTDGKLAAAAYGRRMRAVPRCQRT